jgi:hypothetical protein
MKPPVLLFFLMVSIGVRAQTFTEITKMAPADRAAGDQNGNAVAISGNYAIVGAYSDNFGSGENQGSVYIYRRVGVNEWIQHQKLISSDQEDYDRFGWSVDIDGDYAIVGAYHEDEDANGTNSISNAGAAYIFEKDLSGNWVQVEKLVASDREAEDEFGFSVAVNGTTAIVGAQAEDHDVAGNNYMYSAGSVYVFERDLGGNWNPMQKLCAGDRSPDINYPAGYSGEDLGDQFGWSVAVSGDYLVVGALHHDYGPAGPPTAPLWSSGAAYIFERTAGTWNEVQKIQNFDREEWDRFGAAVDIDSNILIVGAYSEDELADGVSSSLTNPGSAYLWERDMAGTWVFNQKIVPADRNSGDHFGWAFDLKDTLLVIGTHSDDHDESGSNDLDNAGSAYIFEKNAGTWTQLQKIDASDRKIYDEFGYDVALDQHTIVIGAYLQDFNDIDADSLEDAGASYFFSNETCPVLISNQTLNLCYGETVTVGSNVYTTDGFYTDVLVSYMGCDSTVNSTLTFAPEISSPASMNVCYGSGATIGGTYYTVSGTYPIVYTAFNGCDSTVYTTLTIDPEITSAQDISICYGESYTIGLNTYTVSGTYVDAVSATNFCDSVITTHLTVQLPVNSAVNQTMNWITAAAAGATYQWIDCTTDLPIAGETGQVLVALNIGDYAVIVTENGCTDTSACVHVDILSDGVIENYLASLVEVYPNPNNGDFTIRFDAVVFDDAQFTFLNSVGEEFTLMRDQNSLNPSKELAAGIYLLVISTEGGIVTKKVVVQ